jgi:uncharacterized protein YsxB (DUF464 family)
VTETSDIVCATIVLIVMHAVRTAKVRVVQFQMLGSLIHFRVKLCERKLNQRGALLIETLIITHVNFQGF